MRPEFPDPPAADFIIVFFKMIKDLRENSLRTAYGIRGQVLELVGTLV